MKNRFSTLIGLASILASATFLGCFQTETAAPTRPAVSVEEPGQSREVMKYGEDMTLATGASTICNVGETCDPQSTQFTCVKLACSGKYTGEVHPITCHVVMRSASGDCIRTTVIRYHTQCGAVCGQGF